MTHSAQNSSNAHPYLPMAKIAYLAGAAICLWLAWLAIGITRADLLYREASSQMATWEAAENTSIDLADWQAVQDQLHTAIQLRPGKHEYWRQLGNLENKGLQVSVTSSGITGDFYQNIGTNTLNAYREEVATNPAWPYAWVMLARTKAQYQEFDAEFDQAILNTIEYGKHVPAIQLQLNYLVILAFSHFISRQDLIGPLMQNIQLSLGKESRYAGENLRLFQQSSLLNFLCLELEPDMLAISVQRACEGLKAPN